MTHIEQQRDTISTRAMPPSSCDDNAINEILSRSLLRLKFEDRNDIREELHGVLCLAREETPELINESLSMMNIELDAIISASKIDNQHAFQKARYFEKTFVNDRDFRLKFLRCELFNAAKAADRMIVYLDFLLQLFGPRALEEPLKASFFDREESAALREGNVQLLPFRDRSGRRVMVVLSGSLSYSPFLRVKIWFYFHHVLSEDVETQRKGVVGIAWSGSESLFGIRIPGTPGNKRILNPNGRGMEGGTPVRFVAFHFCYPDTPVFRIVRTFYVLVTAEEGRARMTSHHGTKIEMQYTLLGYGIPVSHIPATDTGVVKVKNHNQWLRIRKQLEKDPTSHVNICECPGLNDVLFRRAGSCLAHPGNTIFKNLIESKKDQHTNSNQTEKRDIAWSIVEDVERRNGRFFHGTRKILAGYRW